MRQCRAVLIAILWAVAPLPALADDAPPAAATAPTDPDHRSIAVLAIARGDGVDEGLGSTIEEVLLAALDDTGRFKVVGHTEINAVLNLDAQKQALGCGDDAACVTNIAGALGVDLVGTAHVGRVGTISVITFKVSDAKTAAPVLRGEETVQSDNALVGAAQALAGKAVHAIWPGATLPTPAAVAPPLTASAATYTAPAPASQAPPYGAQPAPQAAPQAPPAAYNQQAPSPAYNQQAPSPAYSAQPPNPAYAPQAGGPPPGYPTGSPPPPGVPPGPSAYNAMVVDVSTFYAPLAPYGNWMDLGGVGHVWRPAEAFVGHDFRPYSTGGHWAYTDAGWAFVSDYDWGWAPFHYGRWWYDRVAGWVWLPGHTWSPAWVDWREGGGYIGWAPLAPNGWELRGPDGPGPFWCFVEPRYMAEPRIYAYALPPERARVVFVGSAPMRYDRAAYAGGRWHPGPSVEVVSRAAGRPITAVGYTSVARPGPFGRPYAGNAAVGRGGYQQSGSQRPAYEQPGHSGGPEGRIPAAEPRFDTPQQRGGGAPGQRFSPPVQPSPGQNLRGASRNEQENFQPAMQHGGAPKQVQGIRPQPPHPAPIPKPAPKKNTQEPPPGKRKK